MKKKSRRTGEATAKPRYRKGWSGGYGAYRYGEKRPVYKPVQPVLTVGQREAAIDRVAGILSNWRSSHFENEASCRHGLRQGFCENGNTWADSDNEAALIVRVALDDIGAVRPTWAQGQRDYIEVAETCTQCGHELDDEQLARQDRFCSGECAKAYLSAREGAWKKQTSGTAHAAKKLALIASKPLIKCDACGVEYRPRAHSNDTRYCSAKCRGYVRRTLYEVACANPNCGKVFRPVHSQKQRFCSTPCQVEWQINKAPTFKRQCHLCGSDFLSQLARGMYCTKNCAAMASRWHTKGPPLTLNIKVFDYYLTLPIDRDGLALSPTKFDLLAA